MKKTELVYRPELAFNQTRVVVEIGRCIEPHFHSHRTETYSVESGTGILTLNGVEHQLEAGKLYVIDSGVTHSVLNNGTKPLVFMATGIHYYPEDINMAQLPLDLVAD